MKKLTILFLFFLISCGSSGDDGGQDRDQDNSPNTGSQDIEISADNGAEVTVNIGADNNAQGSDNDPVQELIDNATSNDDIRSACVDCVVEIDEDRECECIDKAGCVAEDFDGTGFLEDFEACGL